MKKECLIEDVPLLVSFVVKNIENTKDKKFKEFIEKFQLDNKEIEKIINVFSNTKGLNAWKNSNFSN